MWRTVEMRSENKHESQAEAEAEAPDPNLKASSQVEKFRLRNTSVYKNIHIWGEYITSTCNRCNDRRGSETENRLTKCLL